MDSPCIILGGRLFFLMAESRGYSIRLHGGRGNVSSSFGVYLFWKQLVLIDTYTRSNALVEPGLRSSHFSFTVMLWWISFLFYTPLAFQSLVGRIISKESLGLIVVVFIIHTCPYIAASIIHTPFLCTDTTILSSCIDTYLFQLLPRIYSVVSSATDWYQVYAYKYIIKYILK